MAEDKNTTLGFKKFLKRVARRVLVPVLRHKNFEMRPEGMSRDGLRSLIESLGTDNITMVEIGSYKGESAEIFLKTGKVAKIYCIDPWQMFYDPDDGAAFTDMVKVEAEFDRRHSADPRVTKVRGTVDTFVKEYGSVAGVFDKIDLVYIDGLHTYEGVHHDIEMAMANFKPRIAIAGHDYYQGNWPGIVKAIDELLGAPDATFADGSWMKRTVGTDE